MQVTRTISALLLGCGTVVASNTWDWQFESRPSIRYVNHGRFYCTFSCFLYWTERSFWVTQYLNIVKCVFYCKRIFGLSLGLANWSGSNWSLFRSLLSLFLAANAVLYVTQFWPPRCTLETSGGFVNTFHSLFCRHQMSLISSLICAKFLEDFGNYLRVYFVFERNVTNWAIAIGQIFHCYSQRSQAWTS